MVRTTVFIGSRALKVGVASRCGSATSLTSSSHGARRVASGPAVFPAASSIDPFTETGRRIETGNPGSKVEVTFAGSCDLVVAHLTQGNGEAGQKILAAADFAGP